MQAKVIGRCKCKLRMLLWNEKKAVFSFRFSFLFQKRVYPGCLTWNDDPLPPEIVALVCLNGSCCYCKRRRTCRG